MPRVSGATVRATVARAATVDGYVAALAWAPDSTSLAVADDAGDITVLGVGDESRERVAVHDGGALTADWAPSAMLASGGRDGRITFDGRAAETGREKVEHVRTLPTDRAMDAGRDWIERIVWRPDGGLLAAAVGRRAQFWTPDGLCRDVSEELPATITCLAWDPKGIVCGAGTYGGVRLIRANGGATARHLRWTGSVLELAFSPDGRRLAHGNQDASVHFWDLRRDRELEMTGYATKVRELAWSPDGRWLATGGDATITVWDFHRSGGPAGSRPLELERHTDRLVALAFKPGGALLASAARDGLILLWSVGDDDLPLGGTALEDPVSALAWSPDGRLLAAGGADGNVAVLDVEV
jgi:WD40 repeat protein